MRRLVVVFLLLLLAGCQSLRPTPLVGVGSPGQPTTVQSLSDASVQGRVDFGGRSTQATPADVVNSATVSFIDTGTNQTVATGKTDAAGSFTLTLGTYTPVNGGTYLLEAVKGLNAQAPGSDAARFRTVLRWNGTGWQSCTNSTVPGSIVINSLTTALAIETALDPANVPASNTIGKVNVGTNPATLNPTPGPYVNHPDSEIAQLASDLLSYLGADTDPLASVPAISPSLSSFQPTSAGANSLVRIVGSGFSPVPSGNTVTFNGIGAQVLVASPTTLVVVVPAGASTGTLRVVTGRGSVDSGTPFTVSSTGAGGVAITGLSRLTARAGDAVTLTGQFGAGDGYVTLGSMRCATTSVSPTSLTVTVPFGASSGPLSYQLGAATTTSSQVLTVKPGNLGFFMPMASASQLPSSTYYASTVDHNGSVYLIGGWLYEPGREGPTDRVLRATYQADGSLGPWEQVGTLRTPRQISSAFVRNNVLYVVAGYYTGYLSDVERATINADGTLGPFTVAGTLSTSRYRMAHALVNDRLYVIGGFNGSHLASIELGTFDGAGNLTFTNAGNVTVSSVTVPIYAQVAVTAGANILLLGGLRNGSYSAAETSKVIRIPVNANGTLGAMSYSANLLPEPKTHMFGTVIAGRVYLVGGYYNDGAGNYQTYSSVTVATVDSTTGDVGPFTTYASRLMEARYGAPVSYNNGRLYAYGGYFQSNTSAYQPKTVEAMNVQSDGSVDHSQVIGAIRPRYGHETVTVGNNAYLIGGYSSQLGARIREVERVSLNSDGTLGVPVTVSNMTTGRHYAGVALVGNYLYVLGGTVGSTTASIERAEIYPDGSMAPFVAITHTALPHPVQGPLVARIGDWLYVTGGYSAASVSQPYTYRARINADNSIGSFQQLAAATLPYGISFGDSAVIGDYYYLFGGYRTDTGVVTGGIPDVFRSRIGPDGTLLGFQKVTSMSLARHYPSVAVIGTYVYVFSSWSHGAVGNSATVERARISGNGDLGAWEAAPDMTSIKSHPGVAVNSDRVYLMGGYDGGGTSGIDTAVID